MYAKIANIPSLYHSSELRSFFSKFVEEGEFERFHYRHRPDTNITDQKTLTCVCAVKFKKPDHFDMFCKSYHLKHWVDKNEETLSTVCHISRITFLPSQSTQSLHSRLLSRSDWKKSLKIKLDKLTEEDINSLPELNPPALMPNGNVGTPTQFFLKLIQQSKLPPSVITKLGLVFPRTRTSRKYGCVSYDYGEKMFGGSVLVDVTAHREYECEKKSFKGKNLKNNRELKTPKESEVESESDCEDWERHEALHDDPSNQDRNVERLFEENMEVVWEKGGPGIVWYTDEYFWNEQEEEEEKETDDWDVDYSEYNDPGSGDKDAKDLAEMRDFDKIKMNAKRTLDTDKTNFRKKMFAKNNKNNKKSLYNTRIGQFERFSKGIGRKVLIKYGWKDGDGLGSSTRGMIDALDNDGQAPCDKTGFGYRGEKLCTFTRLPLNSERPK